MKANPFPADSNLYWLWSMTNERFTWQIIRIMQNARDRDWFLAMCG